MGSGLSSAMSAIVWRRKFPSRMGHWAIQAHGGGGMCDDFPLAYAYTLARTLRLPDGPDEVHLRVVARDELERAKHDTDPLCRY